MSKWRKDKLVEIINDLESDNLFNRDIENKESIEISINRLKKELDITEEELKKDLKSR